MCYFFNRYIVLQRKFSFYFIFKHIFGRYVLRILRKTPYMRLYSVQWISFFKYSQLARVSDQPKKNVVYMEAVILL